MGEMTLGRKRNVRRKWKRWDENVGHDLGELLVSYDFFREVQRIFDVNKNIQSPSAFFRWMSRNFAAAVAMGVRRISDDDHNSISLKRLIKDICRNRQAITRDWYVSQYDDNFLRTCGAADADFDRFSQSGGQEISIKKLNRDIDRLDKETHVVRQFADRWIAHCDLGQEQQKVPTFADVEKALIAVDELYCKYHLLLTQAGTTTCKPVLQYDWKRPLRYAWIEADVG